jgi:HK97 family phage portal protein
MAIQWQKWMRWLGGGLWNPEMGVQTAGPDGFANAAMQPVTDERALQIAAVFRCVRIISETCASLPMRTFRRTASGDGVPLEDSHWLNGLVNEPNETQTGDEFREAMYGQMAGWGNAYAQKVPNSLGRTVELWPYKVDSMQVRRLPDRTLMYKYPNAYGTPQDLTPDRVLHLRAFSIDGVMGLSPLALARQALGLAVGAQNYASSFFAQGGRPAGVMTSDKLLNDKQRAQIRDEFGGLAAGTSDKRLWVLEASLKYQPITVSPEDMQMIQSQAFSIAEIARFFGVPLFLLMETEKSTSWGSGIEQQNIGFLTYTLRPYLQRMATVFNRWIIPDQERRSVYVEIDETPILLMDSTGWQNFAGAMATNGIMTRNELRKLRKLPKSTEPNADKLTAQTALTPIENLGKVAANPQPTQPVTGGA